MQKFLTPVLKNLKVKFPKKRSKEIFKELYEQYPHGTDAWGLNLNAAKNALPLVWPLYKSYFNVRVFGKENVENSEQYLITSNHSGQIAIDGMLISISMLTEFEKPRLVRAMVERFFTKIPWIAKWSSECGAVLGDRQNCINLLKRGESVLVFPEGVSGVSKSTSEYYQVQSFTRGFFRMALSSNIKILPTAVIGAEEIFPWVYQLKTVAKALNLPAIPISPCYLPLPSPVDIYYGKPYEIPKNINSDSPDEVIDIHVEKVRNEIKALIKKGLQKRRFYPFSKKFKL